MAPHLIPEGFKNGAHIRLLAQKLQDVYEGHCKRLMIWIPPGSMKTLLASNLFVAWWYGRHSSDRVLSIGHGTDFAEDRFGRVVRDLIRSPEYQAVFPSTNIRADVRAAGRWDTEQKGSYLAVGVGTQIAGRRANLAILDDVLSEQTAFSKLERTRINSWYDRGFRTRLLPGAPVIIIQTRWHEQDISGFLLNKALEDSRADQWEVVSIPAILDEEAADLLDLESGESYWPEFWSTESLIETKHNSTSSTWSALYQQQPTPDEGGIFKLDWFQIYEQPRPPPLDYILVTMDTAFSTRETADYSVVQVWGLFNTIYQDKKGNEFLAPNMILLGNQRARWEFPELVNQTLYALDTWHPDAIIIEKKASGQSLIQELQMRGIPVQGFTPDRDKITRANVAAEFVHAGRVWLPNLPFSEEFLDEIAVFREGAEHDDQVDAFVQAVIWLRKNYKLSHPEDRHPKEQPPSARKTIWTSVTRH